MYFFQNIKKDTILPNLLCESNITLIPKLDMDNIKEENYMNIDTEILGVLSKQFSKTQK